MGRASCTAGTGRPMSPRFSHTKPRYLKTNRPDRLNATAPMSAALRRGLSAPTCPPSSQLTRMDSISSSTYTGSPQA